MMTLREAKELFLKSDCSYFNMCTDDCDRYLEYRRMGVSKAQEDVWRKEKIHLLYIEVGRNRDLVTFNRLYELGREFRDFENLRTMMYAYKKLKFPMEPKDNIGLAETILGERHPKVRSGLVYWAYDNGQLALALIMMDQALQLLDMPKIEDPEIKKRIFKKRHLCVQLINELGLSFSRKDLEMLYGFFSEEEE